MTDIHRHIIGTSFLVDIYLFSNIFKFLSYLDSQIKQKNTKVCYIGIANGDSYAERLFFKFCIKLYNFNWQVDVITHKNISNIECLDDYDFIFIGGGNTINLLQIFKQHNFDKLLRESYNKGVKMGGVSAGILCFFKEGVTDSTGDFTIMQCMDFLPYSCSPHFNDNSRKNFYLSQINLSNIIDGYGVCDGEIIHFIDEKKI